MHRDINEYPRETRAAAAIQEEAVAANIPVLVLRDTTERPELIEVGGGALIGTKSEAIQRWIMKLQGDKRLHDSMCNTRNPFGDGRAAEYITRILSSDINSGTQDHPAMEKKNKYVS